VHHEQAASVYTRLAPAHPRTSKLIAEVFATTLHNATTDQPAF
jgi:hypothetical protein